MKNNIIFFENYQKLLVQEGNQGDAQTHNVNLEDFLKMASDKQNVNVGKKLVKQQMQSVGKKRDLIEENLRAFQESSKFDYDRGERNNIDNNDNNNSNNNIIKEYDNMNNSNSKIKSPKKEQNLSSNLYNDDKYFKDLIKRNFESNNNDL